MPRAATSPCSRSSSTSRGSAATSASGCYIAAVAALLSALEAQAVDRPRARLVHDPAEHRAVRGVVTRRAPPDVMEDVDGELFGGFPVGRDSHDQGEDEAMSPLVERMQRELVARGNRLDERRPVLLRHRSLGLGIQHVAQCSTESSCKRSGPGVGGFDIAGIVPLGDQDCDGTGALPHLHSPAPAYRHTLLLRRTRHSCRVSRLRLVKHELGSPAAASAVRQPWVKSDVTLLKFRCLLFPRKRTSNGSS